MDRDVTHVQLEQQERALFERHIRHWKSPRFSDGKNQHTASLCIRKEHYHTFFF